MAPVIVADGRSVDGTAGVARAHPLAPREGDDLFARGLAPALTSSRRWRRAGVARTVAS